MRRGTYASLFMREPIRMYTLSNATKEATLDILSRPWFNRVWVYQELVLSPKVFVQIGQVRVSWNFLGEALFYFEWNRISDVMPKPSETDIAHFGSRLWTWNTPQH
ncbi:hypothetical protein OCU04_002611 [Sclerotinia nivalis]|uniref:Heterokaryon incompatibility domain-containing protein n=1 Tax=Sclerotinia nivalis TaxID=352851 RepID=A0A9X0DMS3_9HELO|nr:hypothetical protein OCU04_002611 [Sclerotinia nivalis]